MTGLEGWGEFKHELDKLQADVRERPKKAAQLIGLAVERQAKINASTGQHKPGKPHIPGTGPGPNRATNKLRNSIRMMGENVGFEGYEVVVGPTIEYARSVEFGSTRWKVRSDGESFEAGVGYPYFQPAVDGLRKMGAFDTIFKQVWLGTKLEGSA
jgi:hypothetical protein